MTSKNNSFSEESRSVNTPALPKSSAWFIRLEDINCDQTVGNLISCRKKYGGKATNLTILAQNGFNVPASFVITTDAFNDCINAFLREANSLRDIQTIIREATFSESFVEQLKAFYESLGNKPVAVRSSSTDEDSEKHSFAGLQLSIINVQGLDALIDAIKSVWAGFYSEQRMLYPSQNPPDSPIPRIAVIVQEFVPATCSGVIFTLDPTEQSSKTMLLNATPGLANAVVEGENDVESYRIQRKSLGFEATSILPLSIKDQNVNVENPCISKKQCQKLVKIAINIEKRFKTPQDIEFSFINDDLFILQARPITSLAEKKSGKTLYTNINVGEALSGVCTPMTWSVGNAFSRHGFETAFGTIGLEIPAKYKFVTTLNGRIYINVSEMISVISPIPFINTNKIGKTAGISNVEQYDFDFMKINSFHFLTKLPKSILSILTSQAKLPFASKLWARNFIRERDEFLAQPLHTFANHELRLAYDRLNRIYMDCGTKMIQAYANFLISYILFSNALPIISSDKAGELESELFAGLLYVKSAQPGLELLTIAQSVQKNDKLNQRFIAEDSFRSTEEFFSKIRDIDGSDEFIQKFEAFLKKWGLRATQEAELAHPRWKEDPSFLLQTIRSYLLNPQAQTAETIQKMAFDQRKHATSDASHKLFPVTHILFKLALFWSQHNIRLREEWRSYVVDTLGLFRYFLLECARRMKSSHCIAEDDDIFFLSIDEVKAFLDNDPEFHKNARQWIAFRRAQNQAFKHAPRLPDTFVMHSSPNHEQPTPEPASTLYGQPASPGVVTARARLMRDLMQDAASFQHGEIIVAESTDIGWTPLFLLASAVLAERGGPLSHSCVVAREYGIPAVVGIHGLMQQIKTGDILTVYGNQGIVQVHPAEPHHETK